MEKYLIVKSIFMSAALGGAGAGAEYSCRKISVRE